MIDSAPRSHPAPQMLADLFVPAPCGEERALAARVRAFPCTRDIAHQTDEAGSVFVRLPGRRGAAPLLVLAAHMDRLAVVVTSMETDGAPRAHSHGYEVTPLAVFGDLLALLEAILSRALDEGEAGS